MCCFNWFAKKKPLVIHEYICEKFLFWVDSSKSVVNFFSHYFDDGEKKVSSSAYFFLKKKMKSSYFGLIRPDLLSKFLVIILRQSKKYKK